MAEELSRLSHILLPEISAAEPFRRPGTPRGKFPSRVKNRASHASSLATQSSRVIAESTAGIAARKQSVPSNANGYYLTVEGRAKEPLLVERFEGKRLALELLSVSENPSTEVVTASLFVPEKSQHFLEKKIEEYRTQLEPRSKSEEPKNRRLIDGIGAVSTSSLRTLWIDPQSPFPTPNQDFEWEVWLRLNAAERFLAAAQSAELPVGGSPLEFPEDTVYWIRCTPEQMEAINSTTVSIARLAKAKKNSSFPVYGALEDELIQLDELLGRVTVDPDSVAAICILDTGVGNHHPLLAPILGDGDRHAYDPTWGVTDHQGHGTKMAGLCGFGDLRDAAGSGVLLRVPFALESVKIYPPDGQNAHDLLGVITAGGVAIAELGSPGRSRIFCLASTTDQDTPHRGRPTSWSAEIDQLASGAGEDPEQKRLFCISAGNIRTALSATEYPAMNDLSEIEAPAQSWNAISVGAITHKTALTSPGYEGWTTMSPAGDLSPSSRTGSWNRVWPIKPDVVLEGGNLGVDPADNSGVGVHDVQLVTTCNDFPNMVFESVWETSAATASAAHLAGAIQATYPELWPETVRALIVDSAEWTPAMRGLLEGQTNKTRFLPLLRRYGYGLPDLERALTSVRNDLTMIEQSNLQPFVKIGKKEPQLNEMKLFSLPWPVEELTKLGAENVLLKVTLSYFVEPNPAEGARNRAGRYPSHGFRFAVKLPDEDVTEFRKRINKAARSPEKESHSSDTNWTLGPTIRDRGSLHSDTWYGPASDLARRNSIAVYPVGGWWKERSHLGRFNDQARFSLVVRIASRRQEIDLYTPVITEINTLIET